MSVSDDQVNSWAKAPSETESERCENAITQITESLRNRFGNSISFIRQGSHRNRTNIRIDSDVDLAVVHNEYVFADTFALNPSDKALYEENRIPAGYSFAQFKNDVETVLTNEFSTHSVKRKNKCVRVLGNTDRVDADVVPAYEYHRYSAYNVIEASGIAFLPDSGDRIESFPDQHYANGVAKNEETGRAFKSAVRVFKHIRNRLIDTGVIEKNLMSSFFLECLVWNVPKSYFENETYRSDAISVAAKVWNDMRDADRSNNYAEVSDLRWLFRGGNRTPSDAEKFMLHAWQYVK